MSFWSVRDLTGPSPTRVRDGPVPLGAKSPSSGRFDGVGEFIPHDPWHMEEGSELLCFIPFVVLE